MSAIKDLFNRPSKSKDFYWAVVIEPSWIQAGIWYVGDEKAELVSESPPASWNSFEDFVSAVDTALSAAIQDLPSDLTIEPKKTVFGVTRSWVENGEIKKEYLAELKRVCTKLGITPSGFVILSEAIAHLVKSKESTPLTGAVLRFSKDEIGLSIFKSGKISGSTGIARSVSVADDVVEGLARFTDKEFTPTRLLLYNGKEGELEEVRQSLMAIDWSTQDTLKLLHPPKIDIVSPEEKILAVTLAGASEIASVSSVTTPKGEESSGEDQTAKAMGFAVGSDVSATEGDGKPDVPAVGEPGAQQELVAKSGAKVASLFSGFLGSVRKGISSLSSLIPKNKPSKASDQEAKKEVVTKSRLKRKTVGSSMEPLSGVLNKMDFSLPKKAGVIGGVVLGLIVLAGFSFWWYYPTAQVTVFVSPQKIEKSASILLDTNADSVDTANNVLPAKEVTTTVGGEKTKATTGGKTVGEKAKGEATIYRVGSAVTLSSGTILTGPGDLGFTLDEGYTVASGSAGTPGETKVNVTASSIGAEYNLASGATFTVGNFSSDDIEAKNDIAFSGGSSREVSAVSEEDHAALEDELADELLEKATNELSKGLAGDETFVTDVISFVVRDKTFSGKVGDETANVKLTLELSVTGYVVKTENLFELVNSFLEGDVPHGFVLRGDQVDLTFDLDKSSDDDLLVDTRVIANLLPDINPDDVAQKILGKYPQLADGFLNSIPGFVRAEFKQKPKLPGRLGTLPRVLSNIEVTIAAER